MKSSKYHEGVQMEPRLPDAEAFSDLFGYGPGVARWASDGNKATIGDYVHLREPFRSWHRKPLPSVVSAVNGWMLCINRDTIGFEIIDHGNGTASVFAHYGLIIGSMYLAQIKADSLPEGDK